jgi:hypothetical protein
VVDAMNDQGVRARRLRAVRRVFTPISTSPASNAIETASLRFTLVNLGRGNN